MLSATNAGYSFGGGAHMRAVVVKKVFSPCSLLGVRAMGDTRAVFSLKNILERLCHRVYMLGALRGYWAKEAVPETSWGQKALVPHRCHLPSDHTLENILKTTLNMKVSGVYRGTSLTRKCNPLGPYRRPMPSIIGGS